MKYIIQKLASAARKNSIVGRVGEFATRPEPILNTITSRYPLGTNIYEFDWDLLVILDTCRVDALQHVKSEYGFLNQIDSIWSVGSSSPEWVQKTFVEDYEDEIKNTIYVTANPWAEHILDENNYLEAGWPDWKTVPIDSLKLVDHVWKARDRTSASIHPEGTAAPEIVTDRAISLGRKHDFDRMIVHYVPPHHSYVANAANDDRELKPYEKHPFQLLRDGRDMEPIWEAYLDELRLGLDWVKVLLSNLDAPKTIISSDHGDAFGEFGLYMHNPALLDPNVKKVPWAITSAKDKYEREGQKNDYENIAGDLPQREEQLRAMGYL